MSVCRSCGAPVVWCRTAAGKRMPVDPEPHPAGNLRPTTGELVEGCEVEYVTLSLFDDPEALVWRSHFVSCPEAGSWRGKKSSYR